uniref:Uncharacterized protein n=1 Tax=Globisporangium ultimum (strain ATCC 200006 / CBS 805.95 / DAOM BR144) TaxID=431595 RepID=K3W7B2_GLOUD
MVKSGKRLKASRPTWSKVLTFTAVHAVLLSSALAVPDLTERQLDVVTCPVTVSSGDKAVGIDVVADARCVAGGIGCFRDTCRYCKNWDIPQSMN